MPLYDYECRKCGQIKEVLLSLSAKPPFCCGEPMNKLPSSPAKIEIKWDGVRPHTKGYKEGYAKDYRRRLGKE